MSSYKVFELVLHVLFMLSTFIYASEATFFPPPCPSPPPPPQNNTTTFYLQLTLANGTNNAIANTIPVAGIQGKAFGLQQFGTVFVFDVNITTTPSPNSTVIGQAYGTLIVVGQYGFIYRISETLVFTSGKFAGSTLETHGIFNMSQQVSNISIVGGTNKLTYATGYATYLIASKQPPNFVVQVTTYSKLLPKCNTLFACRMDR